MIHRKGEVSKQHFRSDRFFCVGNQWFFRTREGSELGPFFSRASAQGELLLYVRHVNEGGVFGETTRS